MKNTILFILYFCLTLLNAQIRKSYYSFGINTGLINYIGDLSNGVKSVKPNTQLNFETNFSDKISIIATLSIGSIGNSDSKSKDKTRNIRNLSFTSHISEFSLNFKYNLISTERRFKYRPKFSPFVEFGIGLINFNPKTTYFGKTIFLQKMGTEGQYLNDSKIKPYSLICFDIPLGLGFDFKINQKLTLVTIFEFHVPFTDYLDDVSGNVPDLEALNKVNPMAAALANRTNEFFSNGIPYSDEQICTSEFRIFDSNKPRGNDLKRDYFYCLQFGVSYILDPSDRKMKFH